MTFSLLLSNEILLLYCIKIDREVRVNNPHARTPNWDRQKVAWEAFISFFLSFFSSILF
jgi:hypothetical protein